MTCITVYFTAVVSYAVRTFNFGFKHHLFLRRSVVYDALLYVAQTHRPAAFHQHKLYTIHIYRMRSLATLYLPLMPLGALLMRVSLSTRQGELKEDIMKNSPEEYAAWVADPSNFNFSGRCVQYTAVDKPATE